MIYLPEQLCWNIFLNWYIDLQFLISKVSVLSFFLFSTATDPKIPLKINVKDKDDPLGQILIPLSDIPSEEHFLKWVMLGPHKKNINPSGEICIDCWIVEFYEDDEILKEKKTLFNKTFNRLTGRSPEPFRKFSPDSDRKFSVSQGNSSLKGSVSIEDISSNYKNKNLRIKDSLVAPPSYGIGQNHNIRKTTSTLDVSNINKEDKRYSMDLSNIKQLPVIKEQTYPPKIASIVPTSGPTTGGTLIQINGKYLGNSKNDITRLSVGGCNCLASVEYYSSNKIMCTTSQSQGIGPITISTRSGGMSSSKIMFEFIDCAKETDENNKVDRSKVSPHDRERGKNLPDEVLLKFCLV